MLPQMHINYFVLTIIVFAYIYIYRVVPFLSSIYSSNGVHKKRTTSLSAFQIKYVGDDMVRDCLCLISLIVVSVSVGVEWCLFSVVIISGSNSVLEERTMSLSIPNEVILLI